MIYSLLNAAVGIESLLLTILIVLGVVVAGALIVYLLWEVVESFAKKTKEDSTNEVKYENKTNNNVIIADYRLDAPKQEENVLDETKLEDVNEEKATEEQEALEAENVDEDRENEERRAYLEARRQELIKRMQEAAQEDEKEEVEEETETESEAEEETETEEESVDALAEERAALNAEKERYEAMVEELAAAKQALLEQQAQIASAPVGVETIVTNENPLSLEELKSRLEATEERLKATEKEFKQCKKEYIPLKKVWKAYEKDEKKLRRKEAIVAKQKVLLYGVNNYADIDPEKAQALAEDIELLDKLKLSVQHCEEVMKNNEERYPLLEKMYNVLKQRNDELKNDIATLRSEIERIEAEQAE